MGDSHCIDALLNFNGQAQLVTHLGKFVGFRSFSLIEILWYVAECLGETFLPNKVIGDRYLIYDKCSEKQLKIIKLGLNNVYADLTNDNLTAEYKGVDGYYICGLESRPSPKALKNVVKQFLDSV